MISITVLRMYSCTCIIMISLHYNNVIGDLFIGRTIFLPKTSLRPVPGNQFCSAIINHTLWCPWCHFSAYSMTRTAYQVQKALQWLCRRKAISNMANQSNCSQSDMYPTTGESGSSKVSTSRLQALHCCQVGYIYPSLYCCLFILWCVQGS